MPTLIVEDTERATPDHPARREFMATAATAFASGAAVTLLSSSAYAQGVGGPRTVGIGPYPVQGMAGYGPTGPLKSMSFQRRGVGAAGGAGTSNYFCGCLY